MNVDERIRQLVDHYPTPPPGDGRALYERGRRRLRTRRLAAVAAGVAVVTLVATTGLQLLSTDEFPTPVIAGLPELDEQPVRSAACVQLAADTAEVVVRVADHAVGQAGGIPGEAFATEHRDVWQLAEQLADGDPPLQAAVAGIAASQQQQACEPGFAYPEVSQRAREEVERHRAAIADDPDPETYATANLLVVLAAEFAPPTVRQPVPDGIPVTFPVHPDAQLVSHSAHNGQASATWELTGTNIEEIANLYHEWLTEPLAGGWNVVSSDGRRTHQPDGTTTGRARLVIAGYGTSGQLYIDTSETPDVIEISVELTGQ